MARNHGSTTPPVASDWNQRSAREAGRENPRNDLIHSVLAPRSSGKENHLNVKPFVETLRVTNPVRQSRASSREASLAWGRVTVTAKRRQQGQTLCD